MKTKLNFESLETKRKIQTIAEICFYGIDWNRGLPDEDPAYITGGIETNAHIISCLIVQWFGFNSCGTAETRDFLEMEESIDCDKQLSVKDWERRITKYLKNGVDGQEN